MVVLAAGVADVAAAGLLAAFLFFFTCFFAVVVGVELSVGAAAACAAANDNPAVASVRESPSNTAEMFFMVFVRFLCRGAVFLPLLLLTKPSLTGPEVPVKCVSPDINVVRNTLGSD